MRKATCRTATLTRFSLACSLSFLPPSSCPQIHHSSKYSTCYLILGTLLYASLRRLHIASFHKWWLHHLFRLQLHLPLQICPQSSFLNPILPLALHDSAIRFVALLSPRKTPPETRHILPCTTSHLTLPPWRCFLQLATTLKDSKWDVGSSL